MSRRFGSGSLGQTLGDDSNSRQKFQSSISKTFGWTLKLFNKDNFVNFFFYGVFCDFTKYFPKSLFIPHQRRTTKQDHAKIPWNQLYSNILPYVYRKTTCDFKLVVKYLDSRSREHSLTYYKKVSRKIQRNFPNCNFQFTKKRLYKKTQKKNHWNRKNFVKLVEKKTSLSSFVKSIYNITL